MIAVIGCGRVGLPLCLFIANKGLKVVGVDIDKEKIDLIEKGIMPFKEDNAQEILKSVVVQGLFSMTHKLDKVIKKVDTIIITIGTGLDESMNPDQSGVIDTINNILRKIGNKKITLLLRSTLIPGTSETIKAMLENSGLIIGRDIFYAFCPERIAEGKSLDELERLPQIVGTFEKDSQKKVAELFAKLGIRCIMGTPKEAEFAKLFNNMYRYVNFALANECMYLAEKNDANINNILQLCNEGYKRGGPWLPGYAAGPCLFKDGFFLTNQFLCTDLLLTSWKVNESLPEVLLREVEAIRPLQKVAVLGLAFKAESDDTRYSLGMKFIKRLQNMGVDVKFYDPYVKLPDTAPNVEEALKDATEIFVMVPHDEFKNITKEIMLKFIKSDSLVVDPWFIWSDRVITRLIFESRDKIDA